MTINYNVLQNEVARLVEGLAIAFQSDLSMNVFPQIESISEQIANISTPLVEDFIDNVSIIILTYVIESVIYLCVFVLQTVRTTIFEISGYINQYIDHLDNQVIINMIVN